jgi:hypothetical protein
LAEVGMSITDSTKTGAGEIRVAQPVAAPVEDDL